MMMQPQPQSQVLQQQQQQQSSSSSAIIMTEAPVSSMILTLLASDEVTAEIFSFLDAMDAVQCSHVCRNWNQVVKNSRSLWHKYVQDDYGLSVGEEGEGGSENTDWRAVYAYVYSQEQHYLRVVAQQGGEEGQGEPPFFIESQLVFSDDGSPQPGNDPENALRRSHHVEECWCTNAFVDKDVDLVADLQVPHLVMAFCITNGSQRFSAPVKEALAFASMGLPSLEQAREYDGSKGKAWIMWNLHGRNSITTTSRPINANQPLAGFQFPDIPAAYNSRNMQPCRRPTVARYVHFKLLSSSKCHNRVSNNIDVRELHTFGIPLTRLPELLQNTAKELPPDPSSRQYQRKHEIREYPWHLHHTFHEQRVRETVQFMRQRIWNWDRQEQQPPDNNNRDIAFEAMLEDFVRNAQDEDEDEADEHNNNNNNNNNQGQE